MTRHSPVSMQAYLDRVRPRHRVTSLEEARDVYVAYGTLLCEAGTYSTLALAASLAKGCAARQSQTTKATAGALAIFDTAGASGLKTLQACAASVPLIDIRPSTALTWLAPHRRAASVAMLLAAATRPGAFFEHLFEIFGRLAEHVLQISQVANVTAANERSLGCAPFLATAKFSCRARITVVQHGNPSCDYLPTMADTYLCRSERWFGHLQRTQLVASVGRIDDFPALDLLRFDSAAPNVALVLHNIGYLEPELDYVDLTRRIAAMCADASCTLTVLPHPANPQDFGLPVIDRAADNVFRLVIGYRSTVADQLAADMPRVSLLNDWPEFFLEQPAPGRVDAFIARVAQALAAST